MMGGMKSPFHAGLTFAAINPLIGCPQVLGCTSLRLVVETEFSASARCVWIDPHLLVAPLPHGFVPPTLSPEAGQGYQVR